MQTVLSLLCEFLYKLRDDIFILNWPPDFSSHPSEQSRTENISQET